MATELPQMPTGDPTPRTLEQMQQGITALEKQFLIRFNSYDEAIKLLQAFANSQPTPGVIDTNLKALEKQVDGEFRALRELMMEKFSSVQVQFLENRTALAAALQAQEKAVAEQNKSNTTAINKSEEGFTKQLDGIGNRISQGEKASDEKFSDVKERLTVIESRRKGMSESWGILLGVVSLVVAALVVATFIIARTS